MHYNFDNASANFFKVKTYDMAYSEKLANRIREALLNLTGVEEKKRMRGLVFMVNGKMCVNAVEDELMCRIDPDIQESLQGRKGWRQWK